MQALVATRAAEPLTERSWDVKCIKELLHHSNADDGMSWLLRTTKNKKRLLELSAPDILRCEPLPSPSVRRPLLAQWLSPSMEQLASAAQQGVPLDDWLLTPESAKDALVRAARFSLATPGRHPSSVYSTSKAAAAAWIRLPGNRESVEQVLHVLLAIHTKGAFALIMALSEQHELGLPAAQQLGTRDVARLMREAVHRELAHGSHLHALTAGLPAAQQLRKADVLVLMHTAVKCMGCQHLEALAQPQVAQQLSVNEVLQLLQAAVKLENTCCTSGCWLPSIRLVGREEVLQLLHTALRCGCACGGDILKALPGLPSAQQLDEKDVSGLLVAAMRQSRRPEELRELLQLPSTQRLGSADMRQLLQAAMQHNNCGWLAGLLQLPAALHLEYAGAEEYMQAAVQCGKPHHLLLLMQLPPFVDLPAQELLRLMTQAELQGCRVALELETTASPP
ncbi:hypothetical protein OEZ85_014483 [Tetradesmus obliquus]|nr:hypothetical protein OEZ85_014483 [Tetradesmus obliquus]